MKKSMTTIATAIALTAIISGPTLAAVDKNQVDFLVKSNISSESKIRTDINGSDVILTGTFGGLLDKNELLTALRTTDGVERIVDFTVVKVGSSYSK